MSKVLFDVPIEPFEERYSMQWREWFDSAYAQYGVRHSTVGGDKLTNKIETGSFLDVHGTNYYKAGQLQRLIHAIKTGTLRSGDWVFFHDLWFPGIEMLAYIRDGAGVDFKIAGCLHAGSWDRHDFVHKKMRRWAYSFEQMLMEIVDKVFVATEFHRKLIDADLRETSARLDHIKVTGFPLFLDFGLNLKRLPAKDPNQIVFPHRLDAEKRPDLFDELKKRLEPEGFTCIKTKEVCRTKAEYYKALATSSYAVSFAEQETWGIAMQEAALLGCLTFVPPRLSYSEMYPAALHYMGMDELVSNIVRHRTTGSAQIYYAQAMSAASNKFAKDGAGAIPKMLASMGFF